MKKNELKRKQKQLKISYPKLSNCSITVRLRQLRNCLLVLDQLFRKSKTMTEKQDKIFAKKFLKNYVIGSLDVKKINFMADWGQRYL